MFGEPILHQSRTKEERGVLDNCYNAAVLFAAEPVLPLIGCNHNSKAPISDDLRPSYWLHHKVANDWSKRKKNQPGTNGFSILVAGGNVATNSVVAVPVSTRTGTF